MHRQGMQEYAEHVRKREEVLQGGGLIWGSQIVCQQCGNSDSSWCCDCPPMVNWGDRGEVLAAVAKDGQALRHATDELKADRHHDGKTKSPGPTDTAAIDARFERPDRGTRQA